MLEIAGRTSDGQIVIRGVYRFYETEGTPLDVILETLRSRAMVPDWMSFVLEAVEAGMSPERAIGMLDSAIADSYGPQLRDVVVLRLRRMTEPHEGPPKPTVALRLLAHEYDAILTRIKALNQPTFQQTMDVIGFVLGDEVVQRMQGEVVGMEVVEVLPEDRFERL